MSAPRHTWGHITATLRVCDRCGLERRVDQRGRVVFSMPGEDGPSSTKAGPCAANWQQRLSPVDDGAAS